MANESWFDPLPNDGIAPIDHLFNWLDGLYPHRWRSAFPSSLAVNNWRRAWATGLTEQQISFADAKRGLTECERRFAWPPSLAEFVSVCRPSPNYEQAYIEASTQMRARRDGRDTWSDPAIYWAATQLDSNDLVASYQSIKTRWIAALDTAISRVRAGELPAAVPQRPTILPPQQLTPKDEALKNIREIKRKLRDGTISQKLTDERLKTQEPHTACEEPRTWWRLSFEDGTTSQVACCPPASRSEVLQRHTGAVAAEPHEPTVRAPEQPLTAAEEQAIRRWCQAVGETDPEVIASVLQKCQSDADARAYYLTRSSEICQQDSSLPSHDVEIPLDCA